MNIFRSGISRHTRMPSPNKRDRNPPVAEFQRFDDLKTALMYMLHKPNSNMPLVPRGKRIPPPPPPAEEPAPSPAETPAARPTPQAENPVENPAAHPAAAPATDTKEPARASSKKDPVKSSSSSPVSAPSRVDAIKSSSSSLATAAKKKSAEKTSTAVQYDPADVSRGM